MEQNRDRGIMNVVCSHLSVWDIHGGTGVKQHLTTNKFQECALHDEPCVVSLLERTKQ